MTGANLATAYYNPARPRGSQSSESFESNSNSTRINTHLNMSSEPSVSPHQHVDGPHRLACQACQRKKIKCDRNFPCGRCLRSNLHCVPSTRKPRARQAGKRAADSELRSRITKLESLVETLSAEVDGTPAEDKPASLEELNHAKARNMGKYMGGSFWLNLTNEVQSLRDDLEEEETEDDEHQLTPPSPNHEFDILICPPGSIHVMPGALAEPPVSEALQLYDIFFQNVDPLMKLFHTPTMRSFLLQGTDYLGLHANSPPTKALRAVAWFSAVTTISEIECSNRFGTSRTDLLSRYGRHADVMFAQADLMNTTELVTLQAYTLYITAARRFDSSRRTWTMIAVIVRIARAMRLHIENYIDSITPFRKELRRRLWHQIRVLDVFGATDRGSVVLVTPDTWYTPLPHNVNDSEINENSTFIPDHSTGITDVTFNRMAQTATTFSMRLLTPDFSNKSETWQQRLDAAVIMGREIRERYLQYCDHNKPFDRFIYAVGNSMISSSILRAVRPIQRHLSSVPPRVDSPFVLGLAVNCLRDNEAIYLDDEAQGWRWVFWVQWHGLAIALAGLCSIRDTELANTAWALVEQCYERHAKNVADTTSGLLWRPVTKLYKKAKAFQAEATSPGYSNSSSPLNSNLQAGSAMMGFTQPGLLPNGQAYLPAGGMPTSGIMNGPMDISVADGFGDMTWQDWEYLMQDMGNQNGDMPPLSEMQAFPDLMPFPDLNGNWASQLRQNLT